MSAIPAAAHTQPKPGDLRVWHVPQIPCPAFRVPVASVAEGVKLLDVLVGYDSFQYEHRIKPDYSNVSGIERYESDGEEGFDWFDVDDDELAGHWDATAAIRTENPDFVDPWATTDRDQAEADELAAYQAAKDRS